MGVILGPALFMIGIILAVSGGVFCSVEAKYPDLFWPAVALGMLCMAIGVAAGVLSGLAVFRQIRRMRLMSTNPPEPWLIDYSWNRRGIRERRFGPAAARLLLGAGILAMVAPLYWVGLRMDAMALIPSVLVTVVALLIIARGAYLLLRYLKYGTGYLEFDRFPFFLGETLDVRFSNRRLSTFRRITFTLRFVQEGVDRHGTGEDVRTSVLSGQLYADTRQTVEGGDFQRFGGSLAVSFPLPDGPYATNLAARAGARCWELVVQADTPGLDYEAVFLVPVYAKPGEKVSGTFLACLRSWYRLAMPRAARAAIGGVVYHVLNRSNARRPLFERNGDYELFERTLTEAHGRVAMRTLACCVMPNHWHMVLWPRADGDLSEFMRWLTVTHANRWHAFHGTTGAGHLYQGRFKSFPLQGRRPTAAERRRGVVEAASPLWTVLRYVERNALRAGLVARAEQWRWCSLWRRTFGDADQQAILTVPSGGWPADWLEWVNQPQTAEEVAAIRRSVARGRPFGTPIWVNRIAGKLALQSTLRHRGRPEKRPKKGS